jgi:hypothetical protein
MWEDSLGKGILCSHVHIPSSKPGFQQKALSATGPDK